MPCPWLARSSDEQEEDERSARPGWEGEEQLLLLCWDDTRRRLGPVSSGDLQPGVERRQPARGFSTLAALPEPCRLTSTPFLFSDGNFTRLSPQAFGFGREACLLPQEEKVRARTAGCARLHLGRLRTRSVADILVSARSQLPAPRLVPSASTPFVSAVATSSTALFGSTRATLLGARSTARRRRVS